MSRKRYTKEEDELITENWEAAEDKEGFAAALGRTKASVNSRYYYLLRKNTTKKEPEEIADGALDDLQEKIFKLEGALKASNEQFTAWLENALYLFKENKPNTNLLRVSSLVKENNLLKEKNQELSQEVDRLESMLISEKERYEKVYKELDFWLGQFMKLSSVEKITSLGDFVPRLKTIVDKYGTVIGYKEESPRSKLLIPKGRNLV